MDTHIANGKKSSDGRVDANKQVTLKQYIFHNASRFIRVFYMWISFASASDKHLHTIVLCSNTQPASHTHTQYDYSDSDENGNRKQTEQQSCKTTM